MTRAPTPCTPISSRNQSRSAAVEKPTRRIASWLTSISVHDLVADRAELGQGAGRGRDEIADTGDVDDREIGAEAVEQAPQFGDHAAFPTARRLAR